MNLKFLLSIIKINKFIDSVSDISYSQENKKYMNTADYELPYLKANQKQFDQEENPKFSKEMIKIDNFNTSFISDNYYNSINCYC